MKIAFCIPFALALTFFAANLVLAQEIIVAYDATNPNGPDGDPSPNLPAADFTSGIVASDLSRGDGLTPNAGIAFNSSNWSTAGVLDLSSDDYIAWGWTAGSDQFDLDQLSIQYDRSGAGPQQLAIAVSINDGSFQVIHTDADVSISDEDAFIDLSSFDSVSSAEFRLFGFDAGSDGGTLDIEDLGNSRGIIVTGTLVAIPEPSSVLMLVAAGMFICVRPSRQER